MNPIESSVRLLLTRVDIASPPATAKSSLIIHDRTTFPRLAEVINAALEKHFRLWAALLVMLFLAYAIAEDLRKPMWTDELVTLYMAQQASLGDIVQGNLDGADVTPPLYNLVVHAVLPLVKLPALAIRLPSTVGYCAMLIILLAFCRRRLPAVYSLAATLLAGNACLRYLTEGRSYGAVLGCAVGALLCWQGAVDGRRRMLAIPLFAFCMALMAALHYYSIFFLAPLFLAEMARWRTSRKLDLGVIAAMAPSLLVLGLHYPFIAAATKMYQGHYWPLTFLDRTVGFYYQHFGTILISCVLPVGVLASLSTSYDRGKKPSTLTLPEWVVTAGLSLMPVCVVILTNYTTHAFVSRYVIWAVPGLAVMVAALLCRAARGQAAVAVSLLVSAVTVAAIGAGSNLLERPTLRVGEEVRHALASLPDSAEPIVVPDIHVFMELSYYAESRVRTRLIYPVSRDLELQYLGFDMSSIMSVALSRHTNMHFAGYDAILSAQPHFVLAAPPNNYLISHLSKEGYHVVPIGSSAVQVLYEVTAPGT